MNAGVLSGQARNSSGKQCISVIVGQRELKWKVRDILAKPGLRRETWLFPQPPAADPAVTPTSPPRPWTFRTAASVRETVAVNVGWNDSAYSYIFLRGVVCLSSVTLVHPT